MWTLNWPRESIRTSLRITWRKHLRNFLRGIRKEIFKDCLKGINTNKGIQKKSSQEMETVARPLKPIPRTWNLENPISPATQGSAFLNRRISLRKSWDDYSHEQKWNIDISIAGSHQKVHDSYVPDLIYYPFHHFYHFNHFYCLSLTSPCSHFLKLMKEW